jgi:hypothetical protein
MGSAANDFSNDARNLRDQAAASADRVSDSASRTADDAREELARLRRENKQLRCGRSATFSLAPRREPIAALAALSPGLVRPRDRHDPVRVFDCMRAN